MLRLNGLLVRVEEENTGPGTVSEHSLVKTLYLKIKPIKQVTKWYSETKEEKQNRAARF